ncbi:MAG TPA: hypothetical protein ENJ09_07340 [Planctomycetes bacterium]|nr:hypothetical protein [Planctomycetota bacterium]
MQVDFSTVQDVESFVSIPEGTYLCRIAEVRTGLTREGSPRWGMRLEVAEGDFAGRTAAWDGLVWSERGLPRVKTVLGLLGYDVSGTLEIDAEDLVGRRIVAEFTTEEREDPATGRRVVRLRVPYMGYRAAEDAEASESEDMPF